MKNQLAPKQKVSQMLAEAGFEVVGTFRVVKGPKVKPDILECWNVMAMHAGRKVEVVSGHTMTELCKRKLTLQLNEAGSQFYGDYLAVPKEAA